MFNHYQFLKILENEISNKKPSLSKMLTGDDLEKLNILFCNLRGIDNLKGKRLTETGRLLCSSVFESYQINYTKDHRIKNSDLIWLDNNTKMPYWLSPDELVLYENQLGVMLQLYDGDIDVVISQQVKSDQRFNKPNWRKETSKFKK